MSALYAGIGCRRGCPAEEILALLAEALRQAGAEEVAGLATTERKRDESGLVEAAQRLARPLRYLADAELAAVRGAGPSPAAERALGLPSVAEAAALAAAGPKARLRLARIKSERATCALAEAEERP